MRRAVTFLFLLSACIPCMAQSTLAYGFDHPQDTARTKVWWFFGETETTREGITADLEAFRQQGVGGVVYYDQVHGKGEGADRVFDAHWWQSLIFASQEARRLGLSFEANIGNGYVAGGRWITPDCSMQRLAMAETLISKGQTVRLPLPPCPRDWHHDVAVLAVPYKRDLLADSRLLNIQTSGQPDSVLVFDFGTPFTARSITYEAKAQGKARTSSMQVPPTHRPLDQPDTTRFYGCGFRELPDIGVLEVSDDGIHYRHVCNLRPRYQTLGGVKQQTVAFPTTRGRYFRITLNGGNVPLANVVVSARACVDFWEAKASLVSDFIDGDATPAYNKEEILSASDIVDLTDRMAPDGTLSWPDAPKGDWLVMRFVSVTTGGRTKHGRAEALGLECDKLSVEGARLHWQSYTKPLIDSIRANGGALQGICMDSHEAGPQNWTLHMEQEFRLLRGYDLRPYLPTVACGLIVGDSPSLLSDLRRTVSDLVTDRYYGEFNRLCRAEGLTLTAQAIGGALSMTGDAIEVKKLLDKPQGEFWGYQTEGNYDIKDCSSAAHVYGKQIASGEAYTDVTYKHSLADIKNLADAAYAFGINELVVCASAYQADAAGKHINTAGGRQYALNRLNTLWPLSRAFWDYQARCSWMLRQGRPVCDVAVYLGDDVPIRTLSHRLPPLPPGYDFDAMGTDALLHRLTVRGGRLQLPDGTGYRLLVLPPDGQLTPEVQRRVDQWRSQGIAVYDPQGGENLAGFLTRHGLRPDVDAPHAGRLYFCHRRTASEDIYFLNNHSDEPVTDRFRFSVSAASAELWNPVTGSRQPLAFTTDAGRTAIDLQMAPRESFFIVLSQQPRMTVMPATTHPEQSLTWDGAWTAQFSPALGGPAAPVVFGQLTDWATSSDRRIRYYSGTAVYRNTFTLPERRQADVFSISFSQLAGAAEIVVNGQPAGAVWCSPLTLDISPYVRKGTNVVEIRVANSLWNRLVGDAARPSSERLMQPTHPLAQPSDELVPSGIIGPVRLCCHRK